MFGGRLPNELTAVSAMRDGLPTSAGSPTGGRASRIRAPAGISSASLSNTWRKTRSARPNGPLIDANAQRNLGLSEGLAGQPSDVRSELGCELRMTRARGFVPDGQRTQKSCKYVVCGHRAPQPDLVGKRSRPASTARSATHPAETWQRPSAGTLLGQQLREFRQPIRQTTLTATSTARRLPVHARDFGH